MQILLGHVEVDVGAVAKHVYAVEAYEMARYARKMIVENPSLGQRITVIKGKVEEVALPESLSAHC